MTRQSTSLWKPSQSDAIGLDTQRNLSVDKPTAISINDMLKCFINTYIQSKCILRTCEWSRWSQQYHCKTHWLCPSTQQYRTYYYLVKDYTMHYITSFEVVAGWEIVLIVTYHAGIGIPPFKVTGMVGAVGRINFKYGKLEAHRSATSRHPDSVEVKIDEVRCNWFEHNSQTKLTIRRIAKTMH